MKRFALISVFNKDGLGDFAIGLASCGYGILSTGGTCEYLKGRGIDVVPVEEFTGQKEIFDGRVKTLHPKIHGGILARRENAKDLSELEREGMALIDLVVVNLYPFTKKVEKIITGEIPEQPLIEVIDIGGPCMLRAAAKNCEHVLPVCDPNDYQTVLSELKSKNHVSIQIRRELAKKVFITTAAYDAEIAKYFSAGERILGDNKAQIALCPVEGRVLERVVELRYGENPHQTASLYRAVKVGVSKQVSWWKQLQGKELSYNNLLDFFAATDLYCDIRETFLDEHVSVVIKHSNPCGSALGKTAEEAFVAARECDPISAFGGIIAVSGTLDKSLAENITSNFSEVIIAEDINDDALQVFQKKKNLRVILIDRKMLQNKRATPSVNIRNYLGEYLLQTSDKDSVTFESAKLVSGEAPSSAMMRDLKFAWIICKHVKSNAIVIVKNGQAIGVGAGQMSRVDSAHIAVERAKTQGNLLHEVKSQGAVAASDAFLPFADTLEILNDSGIDALVQPGGSLRDDDVIECAEKRGVTMLMTGERHFRH